MDFYEVVGQAAKLLQQQGRLTYRTLRRQFNLDDEALEDLKDELLFSHPVVDEAGRGLVWTGEAGAPPASTSISPQPTQPEVTPEVQPVQVEPPPPEPSPPDAERRQLTVMFCDLVGSTPLSEQLDPEDLREVVRAYQRTCAEMIQRFDGHIAQLLGDALLVYFGWPQAHEDDAQRAVRTGLGMLDAMGTLNTRLEQEKGIHLAIRVGIHTGLVVVGEMGGGGHQEQLALGDTPNVASRLQGLAEPDTVVVSEATYRLIEGYFICRGLDEHPLKGVAEPMPVYRVLEESGAHTRFEVVTTRGLTPLVGREDEVALLQRRWDQSVAGQGQVVLLGGEAGIGKSRLAEVLREYAARQEVPRITFRCSPYHTNSALYPVIDHVLRLLHFQRDDSPEDKLDKLERVLRTYSVHLEEVVPLFAALLAVPVQDRYAALNLSPQRQRQLTLDALVAWILAEVARQPVLAVVEDVHWADPSTVEWLTLLIEQVATARMLTLLTFRPTFHPPWTMAAHVTHLTLNRFTPQQIERMATHVAGGKALPPEVRDQLVVQTDGVPLFVEEMTKTVLESGMLEERDDHYALTGPLPALAIPATLHDALMARLDRLAAVKAVAQLGAAIGRQFSYALLVAVSPLDEAQLQHHLGQLVQAELLLQRGVPPQATYVFKHVLIQDAAYQSLLKSTRRQYHQRIAQVLVDRFPETVETQPELVAHHYTEAGLNEQAVGYWQKAGEHAIQRSAHVEAIAHFRQGLALLETVPHSALRTQQELVLCTTLGPALMATKGPAASEVERTYTQALELCQQVKEAPQLFSVLRGLWNYYLVRGRAQTAHELATQLLSHAQHRQEAALREEAHWVMGVTLVFIGSFVSALHHLEQSMELHEPHTHRSSQVLQDPYIGCLCYASWALWYLGFPEQALVRIQQAFALTQNLSHPYSLMWSQLFGAKLYLSRREWYQAQTCAEAAVAVASEQGFMFWQGAARAQRGWALAMRGQMEEGIAHIHQGMTATQSLGDEAVQPLLLAALGNAYGKIGQPTESLRLLDEALRLVDKTGMRCDEAELYRLKGKFLLQLSPDNHTEAETCFHKALSVAQNQHAKSWELRAATSLARLWQQQGKQAEARQLLAEVYNWFTEGFDTVDLKEAKALLDELS